MTMGVIQVPHTNSMGSVMPYKDPAVRKVKNREYGKKYYENNKRGQEGFAKIRGLLKKGQVPIKTNDIVIMTPREFESKNTHFDIIGVLTSKQASELKKNNVIPDYFLSDIGSTGFVKKEDGDAFDFDYEDDEIDIDDI